MTRYVQVLIVDANENIPLEKRLLFKGEPKITDATDQELFFDANVKEILDAHNVERVKLLDKDATRKAGRDVFLEPVKIRELKMAVVEIAKF